MIRIPRPLIVALAALFSAYHIVLALYSLAQPSLAQGSLAQGSAVQDHLRDTAPVVVAIALYAGATLAVLLAGRGTVVPLWAAAIAWGVAMSMILLVSSVLDPDRPGGNGYGTWYVAAVGTMMTIVAIRRRVVFAWAGVILLIAHTAVWAGPAALGSLGVLGSVTWVAAAHIMTGSLTKAARDSERYAYAEREAAEWQAAQEAHLNERQLRLGQTSIAALPMLRAIIAAGGRLSEEQRAECLHLEGAIRDEIRGRRLLDDEVREQVRRARQRGIEVTLLDEGGLDDLDEERLAGLHAAIAAALRDVAADKVIVRTVPEPSETAVTVVGLRSAGDRNARLLGRVGEGGEDDEDDADDADDAVTLWLEIPREASALA